jgi:hypothetical protein
MPQDTGCHEKKEATRVPGLVPRLHNLSSDMAFLFLSPVLLRHVHRRPFREALRANRLLGGRSILKAVPVYEDQIFPCESRAPGPDGQGKL